MEAREADITTQPMDMARMRAFVIWRTPAPPTSTHRREDVHSGQTSRFARVTSEHEVNSDLAGRIQTRRSRSTQRVLERFSATWALKSSPRPLLNSASAERGRRRTQRRNSTPRSPSPQSELGRRIQYVPAPVRRPDVAPFLF